MAYLLLHNFHPPCRCEVRGLPGSGPRGWSPAFSGLDVLHAVLAVLADTNLDNERLQQKALDEAQKAMEIRREACEQEREREFPAGSDPVSALRQARDETMRDLDVLMSVSALVRDRQGRVKRGDLIGLQRSLAEQLPTSQGQGGRSSMLNACRYGKDCNRADCYFNHPDGFVPRTPMCDYGEECIKEDCQFRHPFGHKKALLYLRNGSRLL